MAAHLTTVGQAANATAPQPQSRRQPELDALRGVLLIWMTLTHLPTHASVYSNQTLGFVSAAEGFIFLSALLCGRIFSRKLQQSGAAAVRKQLWTRALRLYGYHLMLLAVAFTVVARLAVHTGQPSLQGIVDFYLAHPVRGIAASILLIYQPPLLDILPMYIIFLVLTPLALSLGARHGWKWVLGPSLAVWLWAQFGLKGTFYWALITFTHLNIPFTALGAFDWFAWQLLWAVGLWIGHGQPTIVEVRPRPSLALGGAVVLAVFFCIARHSFLWDVMNNGAWTVLTDKWHLGALRLLNFTCLAIIFGAIQPKMAAFFRNGGNLVLLGQSSLEVFCAHLLVCFAALAIAGEGTGLGILSQLGLIAAAMAALVGTAHLFARKVQR